MKKILFCLLTIAVAVPAVQWKFEPITAGEMPLIALDSEGYARVLFIAYPGLKMASNVTGEWNIKDVSTLNDVMYYYSLDVDSEGNTFVVYQDLVGEDIDYDLFVAADTSGEFKSTNITNFPALQFGPVIQIDKWDNIHVVYIKDLNPYEEEPEIYYGLLDKQGFHVEKVADNPLPYYGYMGHMRVEFVVDEGRTPHVFYTGEDSLLWHADRVSSAYDAYWQTRSINNVSSFESSAASDGYGALHVAYEGGDDPSGIRYITNQSGEWADELVFGDESGNCRPSIATDSKGDPHLIWDKYDDILYSHKATANWIIDSVTNTPGEHEYWGFGHAFAIDAEGYGHLVYEYSGDDQIYYAKSTRPLAVVESTPPVAPLHLEIRGVEVCFTLPQSSFIRLDLYDVAGRHEDHLVSGTYPTGEHAVTINTSELASGVYFVRIETARQSASAKFVVTK